MISNQLGKLLYRAGSKPPNSDHSHNPSKVNGRPPSYSSSSTTSNSSSSTFDDLLASTDLPPPGPDYYAARRALWLTPRSSPDISPPSPEPSHSHRRLQELLNLPGAETDEKVWKTGVERVWKGLSGGGRLKRPLPMTLVIKIIHAAWLRDPDTWPPGGIAPEPDDVLPAAEVHSNTPTPKKSYIYIPSSASHAEQSSGLTTEWTPVSSFGKGVLEEPHASGVVYAMDE